jgi:hypothetical protein
LVDGERKHAIDMSLFFGAVDFQIAHHDSLGILVLKKDKWIGNEKARGVEHIGVAFAGGDEQARLIVSQLQFATFVDHRPLTRPPIIFCVEHDFALAGMFVVHFARIVTRAIAERNVHPLFAAPSLPIRRAFVMMLALAD